MSESIKQGGAGEASGLPYPERVRRAVIVWLNLDPTTSYDDAMIAGRTHYANTRERCLAELTPLLRGLEGKRVELTQPDGEKRRFWVGRSTGWLPCHLEVHNTRSMGGGAAYVPEGSTVRVIREHR